MGMDYAGLNSGISRGLLTGMSIMRTKQQDDRQAGLDAENRAIREEERGMRMEDRAYQQEERGYRRTQQDKAAAVDDLAMDVEALKWVGKNEDGSARSLNEGDYDVMIRVAKKDGELMKELVGGNKNAVGFAGFRPGEGRYQGKVVPMLEMREGYGYGSEEDNSFAPQKYAPVTKNRQRDGEVYAVTPEDFKENLRQRLIARGAKFDYGKKEKTRDLQTAKVGAGSGMMQEVIVNDDGSTTKLGQPFAQFDPQRDGGGDKDGLTGKPRDYKFWISEGYSPEEAKSLAFQAVTDRASMAARLLSTARAENAKQFEEDRLSDAELQARAFADADALMERYGSVGGKKSAAPIPLSGMAFAPSLQSRPDYNGPVPAGAPGSMAQPAAKAVPAAKTAPANGVKANMKGDKVTLNGKQYQAVNGIVTIDGKKYRVQ